MAVGLSNWIGQEGRWFDRVSLVFEALGYQAPTLDLTTDGTATGAYASNIASQYKAYFTTDEILQIIDYAKSYSLKQLQMEKEVGWIDREAVFGERSPIV